MVQSKDASPRHFWRPSLGYKRRWQSRERHTHLTPPAHPHSSSSARSSPCTPPHFVFPSSFRTFSHSPRTRVQSDRMSYPGDTVIGSPFRRAMDGRTNSYGYSRSSGTPSSGYRSQSWSRSSPGSAVTASYKRSVNMPVARAYSSTVLSSADSVDYSQNSLLNGDCKRSNEKEQLQGLNDRFAVYIDKVHFLEQQNKQIEAEIQTLRQKQVSRSQLGDLYDQELQELRGMLEQIHHDKAQIQLDTDHIEEDIQRLRERLDEEARIREETEAIIRVLKKDMSDSELVKSELEKKVQSLHDEINFIRNNHEEEVNDLIAQVQASQVSFERKDFQKTDITEALREIRSELEGHSNQNLQQVENWFMCRYTKLTEAAEQNKDAMKSARDEISDYRRQLQSKTVEMESVRGTRDSLERQLNDIEVRHNSDLASLQETIHQLDNELKSTKWEMARHLREYQDLLNVKMALDIEIAAYRKLLEGEETHFSTYPYRQAITPPKISKSKYETPKLKVQHKFVEEIIEETRLEDDKTDMDDALAEIAQELSAKLGDQGEDEEEEDEAEAEGEEGEEEEEEEAVVATEAKVSASAPTDEEEGDKEGEGEGSEEGEKDEESEAESEGEGEKGDDVEGDEDREGEEEEGEDEEEVEEVEETVLCSEAPESKASPDKEKAGDKEVSGGEEEEGDGEEEGDATEAKVIESPKEEQKDRDEKVEDESALTKTEAPKTDAPKGEAIKLELKRDEGATTGAPKPESPKSASPKSGSSKPTSPKALSPKSESPKPSSPKAESPKTETPKLGSPKAESPKTESPRLGSPKTLSPKSESPKLRSPKAESPKTESPRLGSPKAESPKTESPRLGSPKAESPKTETPRLGSPKAESPKTETPKLGSPKTESPTMVSPKLGSPKAESPKTETPKLGSPKTESPTMVSPKLGSPKAESPKILSPKLGSPRAESPKSESPKLGSPKSESPKIESPKSEAPKADAPEGTEEKQEKSDATEERPVEKKDISMNGEVDNIEDDKAKEEITEGDVITNGVDESKEDGNQTVVVTKTVETITTGEDGAKHVTKSVTVTETVKEVDEVLQERMVSTKKMEKHSTQSVTEVTEIE